MATKYRIIGKCPFGTGKVDDNGRMDDSMFYSTSPEDYIVNDSGGILAVHVAMQYGGKPACTIDTDFCSIDVYDINHHFGIIVKHKTGWYHYHQAVYRNTVSPLALVNAAKAIEQKYTM